MPLSGYFLSESEALCRCSFMHRGGELEKYGDDVEERRDGESHVEEDGPEKEETRKTLKTDLETKQEIQEQSLRGLFM